MKTKEEILAEHVRLLVQVRGSDVCGEGCYFLSPLNKRISRCLLFDKRNDYCRTEDCCALLFTEKLKSMAINFSRIFGKQCQGEDKKDTAKVPYFDNMGLGCMFISMFNKKGD